MIGIKKYTLMLHKKNDEKNTLSIYQVFKGISLFLIFTIYEFICFFMSSGCYGMQIFSITRLEKK